MKKMLVGLLVVLALLSFQQPAAAVDVGLELSLLIDISGSIDTTEYNIQKQGYANAFKSDAVRTAIANNPTGSIAVNMIMWSGTGQQAQVLPWTLVTAATASAFGDQIASLGRPYSGNTAIQDALYFASTHLTNDFVAARQVIDISGDGIRNAGNYTGTQGRNAALDAGYDTINGLVIDSNSDLLTYYTNFVVGGTNAFLLDATFQNFGNIIISKLEREISDPVPEPISMLLFGTGLVGIGGYVRKKFKRN